MLLAISSMPVSAQAATPGVSADLTWGISDAEQDRTVASMKDVGARWARLNIEWRSYERSKGTYDAWYQGHVDRAVARSASAGVKIVMLVTQAPQWASGTTDPQAAPRDPADLADFLRYVARRYAGKVQVWQIWNEQNTARFWPSTPNPRAYAELLKSAYPAVKQGDSDALVMYGGIASLNLGARQYVLDTYAAGVKGSFDVMGWHPYTYAAESPDAVRYDAAGRIRSDSFTGYRQIRKDMLAQGDDKPIWLTEFGWSTSTQRFDPADGDPWTSGVSEAKQAEFLTRSFEILAEDSYVGVAFWYGLRNNYWSYDSDEIEARFGLLRTDFSAKPAYAAFRSHASKEAGSGTPPSTGDTTAPETSIDSGPAGATSDSTPSFGFSSGEAGSRFECRVDGAAFSACTSPHTTVTLAAGTHSFAVRAIDSAGNADLTPATRSITVTAPVDTVFEAESMTLAVSNYVGVRVDSSASGGKMVAFLRSPLKASRVVTTTSPTKQLVVRVRGKQCRGAPKMVVRLEGVIVGNVAVPEVSYTSKALPIPSASSPAGSRHVTIEFTNDLRRSSTCDRNLYVDKVTLRAT